MTGLQLIKRESRVGPSGRFRFAWTSRTHGHVRCLDCSLQIAFQPAHMRDATVGLKARLQIDHLLIGLDRFGEFPLLHQCVTEKRVIENKLPLGNETSRNLLCFGKAMLRIINVPEKEERRRIIRSLEAIAFAACSARV